MYSTNVVDALAEDVGVTVCRLPPYHCELNPIELVWSQVKRHVAANNTEFKASLMEGLINDGIACVTEEQWTNYCRHVEAEEDRMWNADHLQDDVEPLIIQLTSGSSGSSSTEQTSSQSGEEMEGITELE